MAKVVDPLFPDGPSARAAPAPSSRNMKWPGRIAIAAESTASIVSLCESSGSNPQMSPGT
jgi:hypothetical protein